MGIEPNATIGQLVKTRWPIGYCVCDGRGVYVDIIGLKTMQWELHMYAYVRTQKIALDIAEIPTWVIMSPSPVAAAPPNPLEA